MTYGSNLITASTYALGSVSRRSVNASSSLASSLLTMSKIAVFTAVVTLSGLPALLLFMPASRAVSGVNFAMSCQVVWFWFRTSAILRLNFELATASKNLPRGVLCPASFNLWASSDSVNASPFIWV